MDKERKRLQEARRRIEEQRQALFQAQSPSGKTPFPFDKDIYFVNDQPYHHFTGKTARYVDYVSLPTVSSQLTLCHICKCPTPIETTKCIACDKTVYSTDGLPRCNYCKYIIPDERKVITNTVCCKSPVPVCCKSPVPVCCKSPVPWTGHVFEEAENEREVTLCDSCAPLKSFEVPNNGKWKFKVKFAPVLDEKHKLWLAYQDQIAEENEDEAVQAFRSMTEKKKMEDIRDKPSVVKYEDLPLCLKGPMSYQHPRKQRKRVRYEGEMNRVPSSHSFPGRFQDDMKFTATHDKYRQPEFRHVTKYRDKADIAKFTGTLVTVSKDDKVRMYQETEKPQVKKLRFKVKYRAMPLPERNITDRKLYTKVRK